MVHPLNELPNISPDEIIENPIVARYAIYLDDIKNIEFKNDVIVDIKMKRKGTYHGKKYDRFTHKLNS